MGGTRGGRGDARVAHMWFSTHATAFALSLRIRAESTVLTSPPAAAFA